MGQKIQKLLIANRGEIACRVIRTAKKLGIKTVAVYSDADRNAQHVLQSDEAVRLGPAPSKDSYLDMQSVLEAAKQTGADAIHPGYGFLSENADFARACESLDLIFVGPPAEAIRAMGSKSAAKQIMEQAGVPLLPGYHGEDQSEAVLKQAAEDMGYPVLLKAVAGGGGKGMRQVHSGAEFEAALATAKREAMSSFGDDGMLVEKFLTRPRHVEVQVFFDKFGAGVYLFERDCSLQRRHQKVVEEAPAPGLSDELRARLGEAAVQAAKAINYVGAGTVEFLLDTDGTFYFMEMNTRLQVEHPVTECITGEDLVSWQLSVAEGEPLPKAQSELKILGHGVEVRIYAEDPNNEFLPQTGRLDFYSEPEPSRYVRVDSGVTAGDDISVYYDPMIAKLITWDEDRSRALSRMSMALQSFYISGLTTNTTFLHKLICHPEFAAAHLSTAFIDEHAAALFEPEPVDTRQVALIALYLACSERDISIDDHDPWSTLKHWRLNMPREVRLDLDVEGRSYRVRYVLAVENRVQLDIDGASFSGSGHNMGSEFHFALDGYQSSATVHFADGSGTWFDHARQISFNLSEPDFGVESVAPDGKDFSAPMNGTVVSVEARAGQSVAAGAQLVVIEAMKMEHVIKAPVAGVVTEVFCREGELVDGGATLLAFEADS